MQYKNSKIKMLIDNVPGGEIYLNPRSMNLLLRLILAHLFVNFEQNLRALDPAWSRGKLKSCCAVIRENKKGGLHENLCGN